MVLLDQYIAGAHRQVWSRLIAAREHVRAKPLLDDAQAVVRETMTVVRSNIEMLIDGLAKHGFQFGSYPDGESVSGYDAPLVPPSDNVDDLIADIERLVGGPVPLSLAGFWRVVGSVSLVGYHPNWPDNTDPLWVESPDVTIAEYPDWLDRRNSDPEEPQFAAQIAPDVLHKDNVSGGLPYEIPLPNAAADAVLLNQGSNLHFVEYLRQALRWGGFPGYVDDPDAFPRWMGYLTERVRQF